MKSQMQLAKESIARLKSMSRNELLSELVSAGIADSNQLDQSNTSITINVKSSSIKQEVHHWIECQSVTHNTMRMSL
ncbi:hypothetical protein QE177_04430 [Arsenophonus sp. aPb]|uniref:hypothetical protein n=1 Tax=Arsenophonus sp. aPb TaxID=3041619 RepID=UPI0024690EE2|nr:hypothetical protein [Arsenophonus sp. aPb]WGL99134.1 hypothetical protein QE177_04430 [Arsenophonus sp. aPb]